VLLALDFDGTLTDHDTLDLICKRWAPQAFADAEQELRSGRWTLDQVIAHEFEHVSATHEELLEYLREHVRLRPGLPELLETCIERFVEPVVVSSGFTSLITPILRDHGIELPVLAHDAVFSEHGARVQFLARADCGRCGERCKRDDVLRRADGRALGYVGDGWSDRCAALAADLVFARASLARYLTDERVAFRPFDDFDDVRRGLVEYLGG
jgi:2-hydroxy-3-keto-5-methylthiopentenyl-1-phosphate phosphatase